MVVLLFVIMWWTAFGLGWLVHKKKSIAYKKRWETATRLLKEEQSKTASLAAVEKPQRSLARADDYDRKLLAYRQPPETVLDQRRLNDMSPSTRYRIEIARLEAGKPPRDTLVGIGDSLATDIIRTRIRKGWD